MGERTMGESDASNPPRLSFYLRDCRPDGRVPLRWAAGCATALQMTIPARSPFA